MLINNGCGKSDQRQTRAGDQDRQTQRERQTATHEVLAIALEVFSTPNVANGTDNEGPL